MRLNLLRALHLGDPSNGLMTPHLKKLTGTLQFNTNQFSPSFFVCNTYHRQPSVRFFGVIITTTFPLQFQFYCNNYCTNCGGKNFSCSPTGIMNKIKTELHVYQIPSIFIGSPDTDYQF